MENKNLKSYGYLLNCPNEMLGYVNKIMNDKRTVINWNDFNVGDSFSVEENTFKCVMADHPMKRIMFVKEDEYNNSFNLKYLDKLVQKVNWDLPNSPSKTLYMYGEASVGANQAMQEPLEKLYRYENQPDMREEIREYISELDIEIEKIKSEINDIQDNSFLSLNHMVSRVQTLIKVRNDLQSRLDEVIR